MKKLMIAGPLVSFFLAFLFVGPPDIISQITYGAVSVIIYAILAVIAAKVLPQFRKKKDRPWLALSVSVLSFAILFITVFILSTRG